MLTTIPNPLGGHLFLPIPAGDATELSFHSTGPRDPLHASIHCFSKNLPPVKASHEIPAVSHTRGFVVVGIKFTQAGVEFHVDGALAYAVDGALWDQCEHGTSLPYHVMFDTEVEPASLPTLRNRITSAVQVDYVRAWSLNTGCPATSIGHFGLPQFNARCLQTNLNLLETAIKTSVTECASLCLAYSDECATFEFNVKTGLCSARSVQYAEVGVRTVDHWIVYSRVVVPCPDGTCGDCDVDVGTRANDTLGQLPAPTSESSPTAPPATSDSPPTPEPSPTPPAPPRFDLASLFCDIRTPMDRFRHVYPATKVPDKASYNVQPSRFTAGESVASEDACAAWCVAVGASCKAFVFKSKSRSCFLKDVDMHATRKFAMAGWTTYFRSDMECDNYDSSSSGGGGSSSDGWSSEIALQPVAGGNGIAFQPFGGSGDAVECPAAVAGAEMDQFVEFGPGRLRVPAMSTIGVRLVVIDLTECAAACVAAGSACTFFEVLGGDRTRCELKTAPHDTTISAVGNGAAWRTFKRAAACARQPGHASHPGPAFQPATQLDPCPETPLGYFLPNAELVGQIIGDGITLGMDQQGLDEDACALLCVAQPNTICQAYQYRWAVDGGGGSLESACELLTIAAIGVAPTGPVPWIKRIRAVGICMHDPPDP